MSLGETSPDLSFIWTILTRLSSTSLRDIGRHRTTTRTVSGLFFVDILQRV